MGPLSGKAARLDEGLHMDEFGSAFQMRSSYLERSR